MLESKETINQKQIIGVTNLAPIVNRLYGALYQFAVRLYQERIGRRGPGSAGFLHADPTTACTNPFMRSGALDVFRLHDGGRPAFGIS
jgi:hypothetical protein